MAQLTRSCWAPPLLRWAGSKRKLLPLLLANVPSQYDRYIEPFAGSACLFFALRPKAAVLGDMNSELIRMYEIVRDHPRRVARVLHQWDGTSEQYYSLRGIDPVSLDDVTRAARFLYLNRHCFNGVYRVNRKGRFNVPRGTRCGQIPTEQTIYRCSVALRNSRFVAADFEGCLKTIRRGDFVYLDPPYYSTDRATHGEYGYGRFGPPDVGRLEDCLQRINQAGATFLLSYAYGAKHGLDSSRWFSRRISVQRHVAGFAMHRGVSQEVLVSNRPLVQPIEQDANVSGRD